MIELQKRLIKGFAINVFCVAIFSCKSKERENFDSKAARCKILDVGSQNVLTVSNIETR